MVVIKVSLGEDIRRFSISVLPSFTELRSMLEKLFATNIAGVYDLKYLDSDNDQITVTSDAELVDAIGMAPDQGAGNKLLRLYLVPRGTNPSLLASVVPPAKPTSAEIDLTPLLQGLGGSQSNGANPLVSLLSSLLGAQNSQQQAAPSSGAGCPYLHARPEDGPRVHYFYVCDGCDSKPIVGNLHQCDVCLDFHLCDSCREKGVHGDKNHSFTINPPRRHHSHGHGHGGRWGRRGGHCGSPHGSPVAKPAEPIVPAPVQPTQPIVPITTPVKPIEPIAITKPVVPLVNVPISTPPKATGIVENVPLAPVVIPSPTIVTPNPHPLVPQVQVVPSERFEMSFMSDVTIPDGTEVSAGEAFNKVWRLSNTGPTTWPLGCRLTLDSNTGEKLSSVENIDMPGEVPPGSSVTISVEMEAPKKAGRHVSYWRMRGPSGQPFGPRIWVDIISTEKHAPSAPAVEDKPAIKPAEQYADQLESLYRMGFLNVDLNRNLLEHNKGNISAVIDQLCTHQR